MHRDSAVPRQPWSVGGAGLTVNMIGCPSKSYYCLPHSGIEGPSG